MKSFAVYGVGDLDCDRSLCMESCLGYSATALVCRIVRHVSRHVALIGRQRSLGRTKHLCFMSPEG